MPRGGDPPTLSESRWKLSRLWNFLLSQEMTRVKGQMARSCRTTSGPVPQRLCRRVLLRELSVRGPGWEALGT